MRIIHTRVYTMTGDPIPDGYVELQGDRIQAVGPMESLVQAPEDEVLDGQGGWLLPGLVDAHTHLGMWEDGLDFEGDDGNEDTDPATPQLRAIDALNPLDRCFEEAREAGITTADHRPGQRKSHRRPALCDQDLRAANRRYGAAGAGGDEDGARRKPQAHLP